MIDLRFSNESVCGRCKAVTVHPTFYTRFTNLFKRPRIVRVSSVNTTPGLRYPGEKVKLLRHKSECPEEQPIDWDNIWRGGFNAMTIRCTCDD